jgi:putative transposase
MTTLMRMGIAARCTTKPNTSKEAPGQTIYPYLLHFGDARSEPRLGDGHQRYIPMPRGFVYVAAVIDWHNRRVPGVAASVDLDGHGVLR